MLYIIGSILLIIIDQLTKFLVVKNIPLHNEITVINNFFSLTYVKNTGAAWGAFSNNTLLLTIFVVIILIVIAFYVIKTKSKNPLFNTAFMLIYSGALGNLIDRIFRKGAVVDMIKVDFVDFPVFNFADCCIVIGTIVFCIYIIFVSEENKE